MVSTHSWKANISSPPPSNNATLSSQPPFRSPLAFASTNINAGTPNTGMSGLSTMGGGGVPGSLSSSRPFIGGLANQHQLPSASASATSTSATATATSTAPPADFNSLLSSSTSFYSSLSRRRSGAGGGSDPASASVTSSSRSSAAASTALGDKSLLELSVASRANNGTSGIGIGGGSSSGTTTNNNMQHHHAVTTYESEASAHRLLAREGLGFDSASLGRSARELERRANTSTNNNNAASRFGGGGRYNRMEEEKKDGEYYQTATTSLLLDGGTATGIIGGGAGNETHPLANLQGSSLQQILSSHHEYCVSSALRTAREWSTKQAHERVDARLTSDWERTRHEILGRGVLGNRFLMRTTSDSVSGGGGMDGGEGGGVASRVPLLEGDTATTALALGGVGEGVAGVSSPYSNIVPSPQTLPPNTEGLVKSHLASVDRYLTTNNNGGQGSSMALLTSLQDGIKDVASSSSPSVELSPESMNGYSNAYLLIRSIINCSSSLGVNPSSSSETTGVNDKAVAASVMGSCNFFATQFANHIKSTVREAELAGMAATSTGNNALSSPMARDVCAFASVMAGRDVVDGRGGVWPRLFYCLRCGDLSAADAVLKQFGTQGNSNEDLSLIDPAVSNIIFQLATLQQSQETIFGDSTNGSTRPLQQLQHTLLNPTTAMMQCRRQVADLYERTKTRLQSSSSAENSTTEPYVHYRTACLAMLGGSESISEAAVLESSGLVATVEDYLFGSLWHAIHLAEDVSASSIGGGLRKVSEAVARFSVLVNQWGPSYFEQDEDVNGTLYTSASASVANAAQGGGVGGGGAMPHKVPRSGGWAYTMPLMVTQQYGSALAYLAEAGGGLGLLQATHLGVAMDMMGLSSCDFTLDGHKSLSSQETLLPMLVASYSSSLQGLDAAAALKYLVLLSDKGRFVKEQVQRLMLETRQFEVLAGKIEPSGTRSNGALDAHFSRTQVSTFLVDAANHAVRVGKPADAAELLVLSGRFGALFGLMNRELASYLTSAPQTEDFAKRQFWFNAASQFHAIHLSQGKSYVQTTLESEGNMGLGNTFQLLMNLVVFFDRCRDHQWEGALVLMGNLNLAPKSDNEMTEKLEAFRSLDNCVRQIFHHVVLATMEALCHLYQNLKSSRGGTAAGNIYQHDTVDQSLNDLRNRARLLVTFARLLNLPSLGDSDTYTRISQLEKNMM